jgi:hypothetical protein
MFLQFKYIFQVKSDCRRRIFINENLIRIPVGTPRAEFVFGIVSELFRAIIRRLRGSNMSPAVAGQYEIYDIGNNAIPRGEWAALSEVQKIPFSYVLGRL